MENKEPFLIVVDEVSEVTEEQIKAIIKKMDSKDYKPEATPDQTEKMFNYYDKK